MDVPKHGAGFIMTIRHTETNIGLRAISLTHKVGITVVVVHPFIIF